MSADDDAVEAAPVEAVEPTAPPDIDSMIKEARWLVAEKEYPPLMELLASMADALEQLVSEQQRDLADVERFRGLARTYMDERDALSARVDALGERFVAEAKAASDLRATNETLLQVMLPKQEIAAAAPPMTDKERALAQKEIQGLTAKLRWPNLDEGMKDVYRARIEALRSKLANPALVS